MSVVSRFDLVATKVFAAVVGAGGLAMPAWLVWLWATGQPMPWTSTTLGSGPAFSLLAHYRGDLDWSVPGATAAQWLGLLLAASLGAASVVVGAMAIWRMASLVLAGRPLSRPFVVALRWLAGAVAAYALIDLAAQPILTMTVMSPLWDVRQSLVSFSPSDLFPAGVAVLLVLLSQLWSGAVAAAEDAEGLI